MHSLFSSFPCGCLLTLCLCARQLIVEELQQRLNNLDNHFFYKKEYKKTIHLAQAAFNNTTVREIKAESFFHFARAYHAQEDYEKAFTCYYQ